ncbi:MAG: chromate transporter [Anaerolineaceae bacterium]|nr:MAG: chromate transporter [Anaerolineaceae bacterium]
MDWKLLWQIFWLFTKVAMFSWGGGPASLGLMQREVVAAGWVTPEEFADGVALSNALPGPTAPQASAFVGYKLAGWPGAVTAVIGTVVPATLLMLVLITVFFTFKDNLYVKAAIQGVRPFVVGLLAWTAYQMAVTIFDVDKLGLGKSLTHGWDKWLIALVTFGILTFTTISPIWLVLATAVIGLIFYR